MEDRKKYLIDKYLLPAMGNLNNNEKLIELLYQLVKLCTAIKYQLLEGPGASEDGQLWFPINSVCHSYTYNRGNRKKKGTMIYRKQQFVLNEDSLIDGNNRNEYVEILEPGEVLYISYASLRILMDDFPELNAVITLLCHKQVSYRHHHSRLLQEESLERVGIFRREHTGFIRCSSQEKQAVHLGMGLRTYVYLLKRLKEGK